MNHQPSSMCLPCFRQQFKFLKVATRFGLLAKACLALLLLPVLRGMALFRVLGIQFEASVRYHVWLGTAMIFFATFHGVSTLIVWGMKDKIQDEVIPSPSLLSSTCLLTSLVSTLLTPFFLEIRCGNGRKQAEFI